VAGRHRGRRAGAVAHLVEAELLRRAIGARWSAAAAAADLDVLVEHLFAAVEARGAARLGAPVDTEMGALRRAALVALAGAGRLAERDGRRGRAGAAGRGRGARGP